MFELIKETALCLFNIVVYKRLLVTYEEPYILSPGDSKGEWSNRILKCSGMLEVYETVSFNLLFIYYTVMHFSFTELHFAGTGYHKTYLNNLN